MRIIFVAANYENAMWKIIQRNISRLLEDPLLENSLQDRVQTLILFQRFRLFDGDIRQ